MKIWLVRHALHLRRRVLGRQRLIIATRKPVDRDINGNSFGSGGYGYLQDFYV